VSSARAATGAPAGRVAKQDVRGVSVVIPAYNEGEVIADTVEQVSGMFRDAGLEAVDLIVVDDGSQDDTGNRAEASGARMIRHPHNAGYGRSLKDGIMAARHDTIVITDADGTYPIDTIPKLLDLYAKGFDMVVGARTGNVYHGPFAKRAMRVLLKFLVEFTSGRKVPDVNSGLRVFSRAAIQPYFPHLSEGFSFTTSMTLAYMMTGKFVTYLSIPYYERVGHTKVKIFRDSLRTLQFIVEAIVYYNPIKIFILISFICGLLMLLALAAGFGFRIVGLEVVGAGLGICVVLVFCLGLIAVLLKQIMDIGRRSSAE
jgi:glycosyltransferase involved in cell wall biosynthesis